MCTRAQAKRYPAQDWFAWYPVRDIKGKWHWLVHLKCRTYYSYGYKATNYWKPKPKDN